MKNKLKNISIISLMLAVLTSSANAVGLDAKKIYNKGVTYSKERKYDEAVLEFKKAIAVDPKFTDAYYNLGSIYVYQKETGKAIEVFEILLSINPNDSGALYKLACIYYNKGNLQKAENYLQRVSRSASNFGKVQNMLKDIYEKTGRIYRTEPGYQPPPKDTYKNVYKDFKGPTGIAKDSLGNIYVANFAENSLIQINEHDQRRTILDGKPLDGPIGLVIDNLDNIYVANYFGGDVIKISPKGKITTIIKSIKKPYYLFIDDDNMLYISEQGTNTVIKLKIF